ncbi:hypothetical protein Tco_1568657 [Tanacetum coccineum]
MEKVLMETHSEADDKLCFMVTTAQGSTHRSFTKVGLDAPIIEEYESDSDDECMTIQTKGLDTPREKVKNQSTNSQNLRLTTKSWEISLMKEHVLSVGDNPHRNLQNKGIIDSGCSRHMTGNKAYLADFQDYNGGPVAFGGSKGYITGKGKIKTGKLDFEDNFKFTRRKIAEDAELAEGKSLQMETMNLVTLTDSANMPVSTAQCRARAEGYMSNSETSIFKKMT